MIIEDNYGNELLVSILSPYAELFAKSGCEKITIFPCTEETPHVVIHVDVEGVPARSFDRINIVGDDLCHQFEALGFAYSAALKMSTMGKLCQFCIEADPTTGDLIRYEAGETCEVPIPEWLDARAKKCQENFSSWHPGFRIVKRCDPV